MGKGHGREIEKDGDAKGRKRHLGKGGGGGWGWGGGGGGGGGWWGVFLFGYERETKKGWVNSVRRIKTEARKKTQRIEKKKWGTNGRQTWEKEKNSQVECKRRRVHSIP